MDWRNHSATITKHRATNITHKQILRFIRAEHKMMRKLRLEVDEKALVTERVIKALRD